MNSKAMVLTGLFVALGASAGWFFPGAYVTATRLMGDHPNVAPTILAAGLVGGISSPVIVASLTEGMGERGFFWLIGGTAVVVTLAVGLIQPMPCTDSRADHATKSWARSPVMQGMVALWLMCSLWASWDYHRVSQVFLPASWRSPACRNLPMACLDDVVWFHQGRDFATLRQGLDTLTPLQVRTLAERVAHFILEPERIGRLPGTHCRAPQDAAAAWQAAVQPRGHARGLLAPLRCQLSLNVGQAFLGLRMSPQDDVHQLPSSFIRYCCALKGCWRTLGFLRW